MMRRKHKDNGWLFDICYRRGYGAGYIDGYEKCKENLKGIMKKVFYAVVIAIAFIMVLMTPTNADSGFLTGLIKLVLWEAVWFPVLVWAILHFEECHE